MRNNIKTITTSEKHIIDVKRDVYRRFVKKAYKQSEKHILTEKGHLPSKKLVDYFIDGAVTVSKVEGMDINECMEKTISDFDNFECKLISIYDNPNDLPDI